MSRRGEEEAAGVEEEELRRASACRKHITLGVCGCLARASVFCELRSVTSCLLYIVPSWDTTDCNHVSIYTSQPSPPFEF
jgi:hypothetical protein